MRRDQSIPRENFNIGDRIRCYIYDVRRETKGPQILLSRAHGGFMAKLFAQEVPEVYDGVIEIRAVARDPGSRAKMAVVSNDSSIDPVGACVGMRGSRVQAVVAELQGEKIDIMTESQESERRQREFAERTALFQEALDVDEVIAQLLVTEGFATVEDVAYVDASEIAAIEGFDEDTGEEIQARARDFLEKIAAEYDTKRNALGVEDGLLGIAGVTLPMAVALGEGDVKSIEDLAGLIPDDLRGWFESKDGERVREPGILESFNLDPAEAEALIMRARVAMGWVEAPEPEPEPEVEYSEVDAVFGHAPEQAPAPAAEEAVAEEPAAEAPAAEEGPEA
ncbi:MAG: transcription termination/antitermination protein NusA, partial [Phenylobacterium sp.]|uniref:transcription termination/antitermination protein NusA n=1 Tax=Phenylobacterium sp. TaxID=1871053 RepID=UPI002720B4E7